MPLARKPFTASRTSRAGKPSPSLTSQATETTAYELAEPAASALLEALRAFGYTPETSVADLIDNSVSAGARNVWLTFQWAGEDSYIVVRDDGRGMTAEALREAMRPGSRHPLDRRDPADLGRFGLGLKTASLAQCRRLTVRSKADGSPAAVRRWDLAYVAVTREWRLLTEAAPGSEARLADLDRTATGTVVLWERMDRIVDELASTDEDAQKRFLDLAHRVEHHLAMVFHRYLGRKSKPVSLWINGRPISPWDPFLAGFPGRQALGVEHLDLNGARMEIRPFVLPHHSRLTPDQHAAAGSSEGWNARQGFYVYRNDRLLVAGDWLGLGIQKEEHYKLARIQVDLPNSLDNEWQIDVKKSRARPPGVLRNDFRRIARVTRERAAEVYRHRGKILARQSSASFVFPWERVLKGGKISYRINRNHPLVQATLLSGLTGVQRARMNALLHLLEEAIPVEAIALEQARAPEKHALPFENVATIERTAVFEQVFAVLCDSGLSSREARKRMLTMDPFHHYPDVVAALGENQNSNPSPVLKPGSRAAGNRSKKPTEASA